MLSEKLYFLEIGPVNQKLWPFKCMMLKMLNSNILDLKSVHSVLAHLAYKRSVKNSSGNAFCTFKLVKEN